MRIDAIGLSNTGSRPHNEDNFYLSSTQSQDLLRRKGHLFIVADGVGGHHAGEVASKIVIDTVPEAYYNNSNPDIKVCLHMAIEKANQLIYQNAKRNNKERGMATTITAAVVKGYHLTIANVGDSRTYLIDKDGNLEQITIDHTWVNEQLKAGIITPEQARKHPQGNVVTRSVGHKAEIDIDIFPARPIGPGQSIVLCSDGLPAVVEDHEIAKIVTNNAQAKTAAQRLIQLTLQRGAPDNVTAIVANFDERLVLQTTQQTNSPPTMMEDDLAQAQAQVAATAPSTTHITKPPKKRSSTKPLLAVVSTLILLILCLTAFAVGVLFQRTSLSATPSETNIMGKATETIINDTETESDIDEVSATVTGISPIPTASTELLPVASTPMPTLPPPTPLSETEGNPPKIIQPQDGQTFTLTEIRQGDPGLGLQWAERDLQPNERFVIFVQDESGDRLMLPNEGITLDRQYTIPSKLLKPSRYSWLVLVEKQEGDKFTPINRSKPAKFTIVEPIEIATQAPLPTQPTDLPNPVVDLSQLQLLKPDTKTILFTDREVVFEWQWPGQLPDNYTFEVRIWLGDQPHDGAYDVKNTLLQKKGDIYSVSFKPEGANSVQKNGSRDNYQWAVGVIQQKPYQRIEGLESKSQQIIISIPGSESSGDGDDKGNSSSNGDADGGGR